MSVALAAASTATVDAHRARRAVASRAPSAARPEAGGAGGAHAAETRPPSRPVDAEPASTGVRSAAARRRRRRQLAAAQQRRRAAPRVARHAGHADAAATRATIASHAGDEPQRRAEPGPDLVERLEQPLARAAHRQPADAQAERRGGRGDERRRCAACSSVTRPRENPTARWTPIDGRRRATSLRADAPSMIPAVATATSEKATSSAMTIPAAWPISTCTPARVTKRRSRRPNDTARACVSVTSSCDGVAQPRQRDVDRQRPELRRHAVGVM